jgi:hypothetical protein
LCFVLVNLGDLIRLSSVYISINYIWSLR